jgi:hypothetical protein
MALPIKPPYPPMEALSVENIPSGKSWRYEPKWDGFRCLAFISREIALDTALNFYVGALTRHRNVLNEPSRIHGQSFCPGNFDGRYNT